MLERLAVETPSNCGGRAAPLAWASSECLGRSFNCRIGTALCNRLQVEREVRMASGQFYVTKNNEILGPLSPADLRAMVASGNLLPDDQVSADRQKWHLAGAVKGLFTSTVVAVTPPVVPEVRGITAVTETPAAVSTNALPAVGSIYTAQPIAPAAPAPTDSPLTAELVQDATPRAPPEMPIAALPQSSSKSPPFSLAGKKILIRLMSHLSAGFHWLINAIAYLTLWLKTFGLRSALQESQFVLGKKMYQAGLGDRQLIEQIVELTKQIELPSADSYVPREIRERRRQLTIRLAASSLSATACPAGLEAEYRIATAAADDLRRNVEMLSQRAVLHKSVAAKQPQLLVCACSLAALVGFVWITFSLVDQSHVSPTPEQLAKESANGTTIEKATLGGNGDVGAVVGGSRLDGYDSYGQEIRKSSGQPLDSVATSNGRPSARDVETTVAQFEEQCDRMRVKLLAEYVADAGSMEGFCGSAMEIVQGRAQSGPPIIHSMAEGTAVGIVLYAGMCNMIALECVGKATANATGVDVPQKSAILGFLEMMAEGLNDKSGEMEKTQDPDKFWAQTARTYVFFRMMEDNDLFLQYMDAIALKAEKEAAGRVGKIEIREEVTRRFKELNNSAAKRFRMEYQVCVAHGIKRFGTPTISSGAHKSQGFRSIFLSR